MTTPRPLTLPAVAGVWLVLAAVTSAAESSCNAFGPPQNPLDAICGLESVDCGNGSCCTEGEECGGGAVISCPAGMCCYVGDPLYGAKHAKPQRRAR